MFILPRQPHGAWKQRLFAYLHRVVLALCMAIGSIALAWFSCFSLGSFWVLNVLEALPLPEMNKLHSVYPCR